MPRPPRRARSRKLALEILYEVEVGSGDANDVLARHRESVDFEFAEVLVKGVWQHQQELDRIISSYAQEWTIDRMPVVDRNVLRLGVYELMFGEEIPSAVVINEAVELAKTYSTAESGKFVNGLLDRIASDHKRSE